MWVRSYYLNVLWCFSYSRVRAASAIERMLAANRNYWVNFRWLSLIIIWFVDLAHEKEVSQRIMKHHIVALCTTRFISYFCSNSSSNSFLLAKNTFRSNKTSFGEIVTKILLDKNNGWRKCCPRIYHLGCYPFIGIAQATKYETVRRFNVIKITTKKIKCILEPMFNSWIREVILVGHNLVSNLIPFGLWQLRRLVSVGH